MESVAQVGGAGDDGIDVSAVWHRPDAAAAADSCGDPVHVWAQCKALATKASTVHIRELEGVLLRVAQRLPHEHHLGMLISSAGFSDPCLSYFHASSSSAMMALTLGYDDELVEAHINRQARAVFPDLVFASLLDPQRRRLLAMVYYGVVLDTSLSPDV
ncbi:uncharacterized protein AMSG_00540 [Thecamonas trahens ATCC 50062]|uniref:Restriction endonuclease type IV Mrr domain-containing protein n=1 Tax=Thecamonas trahens ATCC 50062 TaxID=461836 RepID=A0A0L0DBT4_THETB|nr:hypothetical protein AMSG_00540 [Thecamonas trahens ATCC 50062]KNC48763.1 hypothetical protein AMSG_00540 [Thecamonas trahens ATCC 50062]|eukprot:XP_013762814.1 hypothetical protein AMSG_00540 [Thecamonas trahens ATCC 50062]